MHNSEVLPANPEELETPSPPIRVVVADIEKGCDLACPECSVFFLKNTSHKEASMPKSSSTDVFAQTAKYMQEHALSHGLNAMEIVLFGGEPAARGAEPIREAITTFIENAPDIDLTFRITTNGIRLGKDPALRSTLKEFGVLVGLSYDGPQDINDMYRTHHRSRRHPDGSRGTHDEIVAAANIWNQENPDNHVGIITTLHPSSDKAGGTNQEQQKSDGARIYEAIIALQPRAIDFQLNYKEIGTKAPIQNFAEIANTESPYGDLLIEIFDRQFDAREDEWFARVRLFNEIIRLLSGREATSSTAGIAPMSVVAVDTAGNLKLDVAFNGAYDRAADTSLTVQDEKNPFDEVLKHPLVAASHLGKAALSKTCQACPIVNECGGGPPATRYHGDNTLHALTGNITALFDYPSVFCADLAKLIVHIAKRSAPYYPPDSKEGARMREVARLLDPRE